jgi:outer membrane receptor protein involved in Fe transport
VRGKFNDPLFGALDELVNLPKSRIFGAEADITIRPVDGLTINGAVTYLDSAIQVGPSAPRNYNVLGQATNFSGDPLPFTPKWSGTVNVEYRAKLANGGAPFVGVSVSARSSTDAVPGASKISYVPDPTSGAAIVRLAQGVTNPFVIDGYADG